MKRRTRVFYRGIDWTVEGEFVKGRPAKFYLKNGDPGYPAEPSELYGAAIWIEQGKNESGDLLDVLTEEAWNKIEELAIEAFEDDGIEIPY